MPSSKLQAMHVFQKTGSILLILFLLSGCGSTHSQFLVDHWVTEPPHTQYISGITTPSRLQIIVTYDGAVSSHSALRLEVDKYQVTFWDPAGAYGLVGYIKDNQGKHIRPYGKRNKDIVTTHIPTIPAYMNFRWFVGDSSVEVFEWNLPRHQAEDLQTVLLMNGNGEEPQSADRFQTETAPAFCSMAISEFLQRFASPTISLKDSYLWPHNLAGALLQQSPSKVRVFEPGKSEKVYFTPPQQTANPLP